MIPKYLMFAVALVAVATVAVAAMELAVLSQMQQDADAQSINKKCSPGSTPFDASQGRCFGHGPSAAIEDQVEEADDEEEEEEDDE
jgi:hypothetical protein